MLIFLLREEGCIPAFIFSNIHLYMHGYYICRTSAILSLHIAMSSPQFFAIYQPIIFSWEKVSQTHMRIDAPGRAGNTERQSQVCFLVL
jgi:hypothetical protein